MCVYKNHAFISFGRPPSWSGTDCTGRGSAFFTDLRFFLSWFFRPTVDKYEKTYTSSHWKNIRSYTVLIWNKQNRRFYQSTSPTNAMKFFFSDIIRFLLGSGTHDLTWRMLKSWGHYRRNIKFCHYKCYFRMQQRVKSTETSVLRRKIVTKR